jgi:2-amino-4-hydroxy-6-hydroxymethyldihydropteridine diphosphokinase
MVDVIVGLGANLGDPPAAFAAALDGLGNEAAVDRCSRLWTTRPLGPDQADFSNAAALVRWRGRPHDLLTRCLELEERAGRVRSDEERWGPRVLDLDLLIARDLVWRSPGLVVPHPRLHERAFALVPAAEVAPDWVHPTAGLTLAELADQACSTDPGAVLSSEEWPTEWRPGRRERSADL